MEEIITFIHPEQKCSVSQDPPRQEFLGILKIFPRQDWVWNFSQYQDGEQDNIFKTWILIFVEHKIDLHPTLFHSNFFKSEVTCTNTASNFTFLIFHHILYDQNMILCVLNPQKRLRSYFFYEMSRIKTKIRMRLSRHKRNPLNSKNQVKTNYKFSIQGKSRPKNCSWDTLPVCYEFYCFATQIFIRK